MLFELFVDKNLIFVYFGCRCAMFSWCVGGVFDHWKSQKSIGLWEGCPHLACTLLNDDMCRDFATFVCV